MKAYPTPRSMVAETRTTRLLWKVFFLTLIGVLMGAVEVCAQTTTWISKDSDGNEGNGYNRSPSISADGRYVAFSSDSDNLVPNDTNDSHDVFMHDRETGQTTRVSVDSNGSEGNGDSALFSLWYNDRPSMSADGRYVAFHSRATNLVPEDNNEITDIFVHDRETAETTRVSIDSDGNQANDSSLEASISADGRYVAFMSWANNLVPEDTNWSTDIFVHDRGTGDTTRVNVDSDGNEATSGMSYSPSISADGRHVAFKAWADNLVPEDTNVSYDIFVHNRETGETTRASVDSDGNEANGESSQPWISADGRYVAFASWATNLVPDDTTGEWEDIFVHDRETGETTRVSVDSDGNEVDGWSVRPTISADGIHVAFESTATNLVPEDTNDSADVFVHDCETGETIRVSVDSDGNEANSGSIYPLISADGIHVAFESTATNLVPEDNSSYFGLEVYVHGPLTTEQLDVSIDIAPKRDPNRINPEHGHLAVAILTEESFDATDVDPGSVRFGPGQAKSIRDRVRDIDRDSDTDMVLYFQTAETGISCGDTEATLTGETFEGVSVTGSDTIVPVGCR